MKINLICIFVLHIFIVQGQSLNQKMWDFGKACNFAVREGFVEGTGREPQNVNEYCSSCIDDTNNGYLFIQGTWPACGCSCSDEIGAYKRNDNEFTLISYSTWPCENSFGIYSSDTLENIIPSTINLESLILNYQYDTLEYFFTEMKIPRKGTDTKIMIKPFPLGQVGHGKRGISYNSIHSKVIHTDLSSIKYDLLKAVENDEQINLILDHKINQLPESVSKKIYSLIGKNKEFKSVDDLIEKLLFVKKVYKLYMSLEYNEMVLTWNRSTNRFDIKEKINSLKKISFIEFIRTAENFSIKC